MTIDDSISLNNLAAQHPLVDVHLLSNPFKAGGYVCIVHFGEATVHVGLYEGEA